LNGPLARGSFLVSRTALGHTLSCRDQVLIVVGDGPAAPPSEQTGEDRAGYEALCPNSV
jgi:hypothetical protein